MIIGAPNTNNKATRLKAVSKAITAPCPPTARPTMAVAVFAAALASTPRDTSKSVVAAIRSASAGDRSEEHTSELQSLMRISYAVFCLKKKNKQQELTPTSHKYNRK